MLFSSPITCKPRGVTIQLAVLRILTGLSAGASNGESSLKSYSEAMMFFKLHLHARNMIDFFGTFHHTAVDD